MRRRVLAIGAILLAFLALEPLVRRAIRPGPPAPTGATLARASRVTILRDRWGVPHVFGRSDSDAAFGLAWAHAEDDFPTIQAVLAASRGRLGLVKPGKTSLLNDGYAALVDVEGEATRGWEALEPATRAVFDAYAEGLTFYASRHPGEADARLLPYEGKDIARGFAHKLPLMLGFPDAVKALAEEPAPKPVMPGSNAHAVAPWRSADGVTRLNVNSHQPWEGPVSWYEAHVHSDEGWDVVGGTFPGAPMILHGAAATFGWALTVNTADRIDAYALVTDDDHPGAYRFGGEWLPFEETRAWLPLDTPWLTLWIPKTFRRTVHGPVVTNDRGTFAIRHVGAGQGVRAGEQWLRMNKAADLDAWRAVMATNAIPMFNVVYADAAHVGYVYNARIPVRDPRFDWAGVLPGDDPAALWTEVVPFAELPRVTDPPSGFVQACNSAPSSATSPEPSFVAPAGSGIETRVTNRASRTLELLAGGAPVDRDAFLALKWDEGLSADAPLRRLLLDPIRDWTPDDPDAARARELLLGWDGTFDVDDPGAGVAVLAWRGLDGMGWRPEGPFDARARVAWAAETLRERHGRIEVPLGEVQRLVRGDVELPLGGGPDVLHCTYTDLKADGSLVGDQGDSYVMIVEYGPDGRRVDAVHQYGASNRPGSPHYADQAPLFVERRLRPVPLTLEAIRAEAESELHPGDP